MQSALKKLAKLVRRHDVPVTESVIEAPAVDFLAVLEDLSLNTEARCLAATLQSIEKDLNAAARRANAWANGSALALRALDYPDVEGSCTQVIFERPEAAELQEEVEGFWVNAERRYAVMRIPLPTCPCATLFTPTDCWRVCRLEVTR
ncbi:MAG: hypothetical protein CM15mP120_20670 [Pseudomonadota bacterium]|nr:MAG: hypothetical protein CM15mP120_20670 [Pseudomonadota bacterium]